MPHFKENQIVYFLVALLFGLFCDFLDYLSQEKKKAHSNAPEQKKAHPEPAGSES